MARTLVKPQLAKAAMMDEMSWARQKASMRATEGLSMKHQPCERVMKMSACEMMATWEMDGRQREKGEKLERGREKGADLEVDDHVSPRVADLLDGLDTESVLEEVGLVHDDVEDDGREREVET